MKKLYKQINKYLILVLSVLSVAFAGVFMGLSFGSVSRSPQAEEVTATGVWSDFTTQIADEDLANDSIYISKPGQFAYVCKKINEGESFAGKTFYIHENLDFSAHYWVPMGSGIESGVNASFVGGEQGDKKIVTLSGIIINNSVSGYAGVSDFGFFGSVANCGNTGNGFMQGIAVEVNYNIDVSKVSASTINIGGLAGYYAGNKENGNATTSNAGLIDCSVKGKITITGTPSPSATINVGGLVGQVGTIGSTATGSTISYNSECENNVDLTVSGSTTATYNIGGIVGQNAGTLDFWGLSSNYNRDVSCIKSKILSNTGSVGGVVGNNLSGAVIQNVTSGVASADSIDYSQKIVINAQNSSTIYAGGIAGTNLGTISGCTNKTTLNCYAEFFGGIAGTNQGTISTCKNNAPIYLNTENISQDKIENTAIFGGIAGLNSNLISECVNNGFIGASSKISISGGIIGGIAGENYAGKTITNCLNYAQIGLNMNAKASGGIAGSNAGKITSDINKNSVTKFTANLGEVYAGGSAGGIVGMWNIFGYTLSQGDSLAWYCYNVGKIVGSTSSGGIVGTMQNADSSIEFCMNFGEVGDVSETKVTSAGGIVGEGYASNKFSIKNCANYAKVSASSRVGGIIGYVKRDSSEVGGLTLSYVIATGEIKADSIAGGIVGSGADYVGTIDFSTSIYDIGVIGYDSNTGKISQIPREGSENDSSFDIYSAPLTYYMTSPGINSSVGYYINKTDGFTSNSAWFFKENSNNTYFYPVLKVFEEQNFFTTTKTTQDSQSLSRTYPSQQLELVKIQNKLPTGWDSENNEILYQSYYINIYPGIDLLNTQPSVDDTSFAGQYVIVKHKIAQPTKISKAIYISESLEKDAFNTKVQKSAWAGQYNIHEGFEEKFVNTNSKKECAFPLEITEATNIQIQWLAKKITVNVYEYDSETSAYAKHTTAYGFTYSMNPEATTEISLPTKKGKTYYGWRVNADLVYKDSTGAQKFDDEDKWIEAWQTDTKTNFSANSWETLDLYCMSVDKRISVNLEGGLQIVNGNNYYGRFETKDGTNFTKNITIIYGKSYVVSAEYDDSVSYLTNTLLPIPTILLVDYTFRGYRFGDNIYMEGATFVYVVNEDTETVPDSITLTADWIYIMQTIKYVSIVNSNEIGLKTFKGDEGVRFNEYIPTDKQANISNLSSWGINYQKVDPTCDPQGYSFDGVYSDSAYTMLFNFNTTPICDNTTLYIKWKLNEFQVKLCSNITSNRSGSWGDGSQEIVISVPYRTNLVDFLANWQTTESNTSRLINVQGFLASLTPNSTYHWTVNTSVAMGEGFSADLLLINSNYKIMPAISGIKLYIVWTKKTDCKLIFNANGGNFGDSSDITITKDATYEVALPDLIKNFTDLTTPLKPGFIFKFWSLTSDGSTGKISSYDLMTEECSLYAIYGEERTVTFYVAGGYPENKLGELKVYDGAVLGSGIDGMDEMIRTIQETIKGKDETTSPFSIDYWVEITIDMGYNIEESPTKFDFNSEPIIKNTNLLAKLKPNENYIPPTSDPTKYILIAGAVIIVALILLFVVLLVHPSRVEYKSNKKCKNQDIQTQLDEIRELERRRRKYDNPYD